MLLVLVLGWDLPLLMMLSRLLFFLVQLAQQRVALLGILLPQQDHPGPRTRHEVGTGHLVVEVANDERRAVVRQPLRLTLDSLRVGRGLGGRTVNAVGCSSLAGTLRVGGLLMWLRVVGPARSVGA